MKTNQNLLAVKRRAHNPYIQNTYVYTLDLTALNITSTVAMPYEWECIHTGYNLG